MQVQCLHFMIQRGLTSPGRYRKLPAFGPARTQERKRPDRSGVVPEVKQANLSRNA